MALDTFHQSANLYGSTEVYLAFQDVYWERQRTAASQVDTDAERERAEQDLEALERLLPCFFTTEQVCAFRQWAGEN